VRHSEMACSTSDLGQYLPKSDVCVTSVQPPITDSCRTSRHFAFGPEVDIPPPARANSASRIATPSDYNSDARSP
jgi:hypothetical protein